MSILKEFREFAVRGNLVDMAAGIIIGGAFGKIVSSLVNDLVMPPVGLLLGNVDFSKLAVTLREKSESAEAIEIRYGLFLNNLLDFLIAGVCIFFLIKGINRLRRKQKEVAVAPETRTCPHCCSFIALEAKRCPHCTSHLDS